MICWKLNYQSKNGFITIKINDWPYKIESIWTVIFDEPVGMNTDNNEIGFDNNRIGFDDNGIYFDNNRIKIAK